MAKEDEKEAILSVPYKAMLYTSYAGIFFGLTGSIVASLYYDFGRVTGTHCRVANFLPTISAASQQLPGRLIWQIGVFSHVPRGFIDVAVYHIYLSKRFAELNRDGIFNTLLVWILSILFTCHHLSLILLTLVTSEDEYYFLHEFGFVSFMVTGFIHMILFMYALRATNADGRGLKSVPRRFLYFALHVVLFAFSMYLFFRHNWYCEPYMYSFYAFVEYFVVWTNVSFYFEILNDFPDIAFVMAGSGHRVVKAD